MNHIFSTLYSLISVSLVGCAPDTTTSVAVQTEASDAIVLSAKQMQIAHIELASLEKKTVEQGIACTGLIDIPPSHNVSIHSIYGGFISELPILSGMHVQKGDLLVSIENPVFIDIQQQYLESLANRGFLEEEYKRQEKLFAQNISSAKIFQQAKSAYLVNESKISSAEAKLTSMGVSLQTVQKGKISPIVQVYAPIDGVVRDVQGNIGKHIGEQDIIMSITNAEDLHVELQVYEKDVPNLAIGQPIHFSLANSPEISRDATVFLVSGGVGADRTISVHGHLSEQYTDILPGMYVQAEIVTASTEGWVVPEDAVVRFAGNNYIFLKEPEHTDAGDASFVMQEVQLGSKAKGYQQIVLPAELESKAESLQYVRSGAFTVLAKAKNLDEE